MEKKMYHIPTAEMLAVETKDVISISGLIAACCRLKCVVWIL